MSQITRVVAAVHTESLCPCSHIISVQFWESVTWDRKLCELVLSSLLQQTHAQDQCNFSITFPPVAPPLQLPLIPVRVADPEPQTRGGKYGFILTAFHSRKAECLVNCYAPFYPLHRPDNVSQRRNLTSSRLDPTEQRSDAARTGRLLYCL